LSQYSLNTYICVITAL